MTGTSDDDFLGGRLRLSQPVRGYRAGIDPVLLAASVPARAGQRVLDLGTGSGVALFCLMARVDGLLAHGIERDEALARIAARNAARNGLDADIVTGDLAALPSGLRDIAFDHVLANPPFFDRARGSVSDAGREAGRGEETPLPTWMETAVRRLRPGGCLSVIQRIERLPDLLGSLDHRVGDVTVLPCAPRIGRPAKLFILQARKGAKGPFRLATPLILHAGATHERDGDDYTPDVSAILRDGAALELGKFTNT